MQTRRPPREQFPPEGPHSIGAGLLNWQTDSGCLVVVLNWYNSGPPTTLLNPLEHISEIAHCILKDPKHPKALITFPFFYNLKLIYVLQANACEVGDPH